MDKQLSRRRFLAGSLLTTAAASITALPAFGQANSPNEKLGVMVMGCGGRGGDHIKAMLADPRTVVLYVCDPDTKRAAAWGEKIKAQQGIDPKVIIDMREALSDKNLDVVTCASVNHWHTLCGIWALQAGKHVFLEKPISSSIHEGKAITAAAKKYGKICQVGTQRRSFTAHIEAVDFVKKGGIGDVKLARGICYKRRKSIGPLGKYPLPPTVDYDFWCGPRPNDPPTRPTFHYDWHWQREYGNGEIGNNGPHFCDLARWYLGLERFPDQVYAYGGRIGYDIERKDPDYVDAGNTPNTHVSVFGFGDKTVVMECRGLESPKLNGVDFGTIIYGSEGFLTATDKTCIVFDNNGNETKRFTGGGDNFKEFVDSVENNDPVSVKADARCGALSAAMCHLGNIAYYVGESDKQPAAEIEKRIPESHQVVFQNTMAHLEKNGIDTKKSLLSLGPVLKLNPEKEEFVGNDAANSMFSRGYRDGFVVPDPDKV